MVVVRQMYACDKLYRIHLKTHRHSSKYMNQAEKDKLINTHFNILVLILYYSFVRYPH